MKNLPVAITLDNSQSNSDISFSNGISQNVKFFYDLLKLIGHKPYFMVQKAAPDNTLTLLGKSYRAFTPQEVVQQAIKTRIVFEAGVSVNQAQRSVLREKFGSKIVSVRYGHSMFMDMEQICHAETMTPGLYVNKPDAVWASPHFKEAYPYLETIYQAPVRVCPYIWEPDFISKNPKPDLKLVPDVYVMEPNLSILKNALIPMAILERLYRQQPDSFGKAMILNGLKFNQGKFFLDNIVKNFSCLRAEVNKVFFTGRYRFHEVFKERDILLAHQYGCELNYLYLEALYRNIPLVHNSPAFADVGYYYEGFDVNAGAEALSAALKDTDIQNASKSNKAFVKRYSVKSFNVQNGYKQLIDELF